MGRSLSGHSHEPMVPQKRSEDRELCGPASDRALSHDRSRRRMPRTPIFFAMRVQSRNARKTGNRVGRFGQVFVAVKAHRYPDLGFRAVARRRILERGGGPDHAQNPAPAADRHAFSQGDLRRHSEREHNFSPCFERRVGEKKDAPRTQILREPQTIQRSRGLAKRERKQIGESLPNAAFHPNWRSGHRVASIPFAVVAGGSVTRYCSSPRTEGEVTI